ncbi:MAG: hypothetical protein LBU11_06345 [Zoogloeaceae bacterium]|jgi:hypothetical protein|nr:hypothetical protein [Zoogloeaceae bacterium]
MTTADADLAALLSRIAIAHQIPGRVRLKLLRLPEPLRAKLDAPALARFFAGLRQISGITQVKPNALALSCTILYTPARLPDHVWRETFGAPSSSSSSSLSRAAEDFQARLRQSFLESQTSATQTTRPGQKSDGSRP